MHNNLHNGPEDGGCSRHGCTQTARWCPEVLLYPSKEIEKEAARFNRPSPPIRISLAYAFCDDHMEEFRSELLATTGPALKWRAALNAMLKKVWSKIVPDWERTIVYFVTPEVALKHFKECERKPKVDA